MCNIRIQLISDHETRDRDQVWCQDLLNENAFVEWDVATRPITILMKIEVTSDERRAV